MDLGLENKRALVAASSKGLGRAIAEQLAAEGARIMLASRNEATLRQTATEIQEKIRAEAGYCVTDLSRPEDVQHLVSRTVEEFGGLEILITNSGGPPAGTFEEFDDAGWQRAFEMNLLSVVRLIRAALPHLQAQSSNARILNIASSSIKEPIENLILSNTFRAGVAGLSKSLSFELAKDGILVNTLGPGRIATDRVLQIDAARAESLGVPVEEVRQQSEAAIPLGRYGEPEELARVATFLVSPANTYVTGQALLVDGGMVKAL